MSSLPRRMTRAGELAAAKDDAQPGPAVRFARFAAFRSCITRLRLHGFQSSRDGRSASLDRGRFVGQCRQQRLDTVGAKV
ncbi:hypothetical protein J3E61_006612 [Mycobacterium sp. OAE908]